MTQKSVALFSNNEGCVSPLTPLAGSLGMFLGSIPPRVSPSSLSIAAPRASTATLWNLPDSATVSTKEAAAMLGRSKRTLEGWRIQHRGPAYQAGGRVTYTIGDLKKYLVSQTIRPALSA